MITWTQKEMDRMFNPKVVAVVGDKANRDYNWLRSVQTLRGKVYSVQLDESEIPGIEALGITNYKSLQDIPEPVDYVIVTVPRAVAPIVLKDAIAKKVGGVMFFTAGFAETGSEEGIRLQKVLTDMATQANMKVVGPNCMGIFNPKAGLRHNQDQYHGEGGSVGFMSQSGTHANFFSTVGYLHGIKISKSVSFGNGIDLDVTDYLEYMGNDGDTKVIGMYVEGPKDGPRFFRVLRDVAARKPVVVWKGGQTEEGTRAAQSHTAALASSALVWDAMIKQCGAIGVDSFDDLIDTTKTLLYVKSPSGRRMGLVAMTGGQSVVVTDTFSRQGLSIPALTEKSYQEYESFYSVTGGSYRNPLDMTPNSRDLGLVQRVLEILVADENVDAVAYELNMGFLARGEGFMDSLLDILAGVYQSTSKPFFVVLTPATREKEAVDVRQLLIEKGLASFPNFQRAAAAYRRLVDYHAFKEESDYPQASVGA